MSRSHKYKAEEKNKKGGYFRRGKSDDYGITSINPKTIWEIMEEEGASPEEIEVARQKNRDQILAAKLASEKAVETPSKVGTGSLEEMYELPSYDPHWAELITM